MATDAFDKYLSYTEIITGLLLCIIASYRSKWHRTAYSVAFACGMFTFGFSTSLSFVEYYFDDLDSFTETTAALVGAGAAALAVVLYLITQAPFPNLVFGTYIGAVGGTAVLFLIENDMTNEIASPAREMLVEAIAIVVGFLILLLSNRLYAAAGTQVMTTVSSNEFCSDFLCAVFVTLFGSIMLMHDSNESDPDYICNASSTSTGDIAVFLGLTLGMTAAFFVVMLMVHKTIDVVWRRCVEDPGEVDASYGMEGELEHPPYEETRKKKKKNPHIGKPPSKMRKRNRKVKASSRKLGLKHWMEVARLNTTLQISNWQRLMYRLAREGYRIRVPDGGINEGPDCQFEAAVDQLVNILGHEHEGLTPEVVRAECVEWLRCHETWCNMRLSDYVPNNDWAKFLEDMSKETQWGNEITLIAIASVYDCRVLVVTAMEGERYLISIDTEEHTVPLGSTKAEVQRGLLEQSTALAASITSADEGDIVVEEEIQRKVQPRASRTIRLWQCGERRYGSLERGKMQNAPGRARHDHSSVPMAKKNQQREPGPTDMLPGESGMRARTRPVTRLANVVIQILIGISGIWWIVWILFIGTNLREFWGGVEYIIFVFAELVNFILGTIYFLNFCYPVQRRWRSLDELTPRFNLCPEVNALVFHCSEDVDDTKRTIEGCMRMDTMNSQITLNNFVCDDGFFKKIDKGDKGKRQSWVSKIGGFFQGWFNVFGCGKVDDVSSEEEVERAVQETTEHAPLLRTVRAHGNLDGYQSGQGAGYQSTDDRTDMLFSNASEKLMSAAAVEGDPALYSKGTTLMSSRKAGDDFLHVDEEGGWTEAAVMKWVQKRGFEPTLMGVEMIEMMREVMSEFFQQEHNLTVDIDYKVRLTLPEELVRPDCAQATVRYTFYPRQEVAPLKYPSLHLVARVKPVPPRTHHYKAGNVNNVLFNERIKGKYALLLDNDMKPKRNLLTRMLPWFYTWVEDKARYYHNKAIAFTQAPQHFKWETTGPEDILGGRNSIFFAAIQRGRDGFESCAFAGTNAIFRIGALKSVQGLPYESLTEDALLGMNLHGSGYSSIYVEDKLAVGLAPVTVGSAMGQRKRWCKGSIEILLKALTCGNSSDIEWGSEGRVAREPNVRSHNQARRSLFQLFFKIDTMTYPISGATALLYMVVALIFAFTGQGPLHFNDDNYVALLYTFIPYYTLKILASLVSYAGSVRADDVWRAQEIWFSYSWAAFLGIVEAVTGTTGWGLTGTSARTNNLEWFNIIMVLLLCVGILVRFVIFLLDSASDLLDLGALFFAATIVIQMWPMVSMSIYERVVNSYLDEEDIEELHRAEIPTYLLYGFIIIVGIVVSESVSFGGV